MNNSNTTLSIEKEVPRNVQGYIPWASSNEPGKNLTDPEYLERNYSMFLSLVLSVFFSVLISLYASFKLKSTLSFWTLLYCIATLIASIVIFLNAGVPNNFFGVIGTYHSGVELLFLFLSLTAGRFRPLWMIPAMFTYIAIVQSLISAVTENRLISSVIFISQGIALDWNLLITSIFMLWNNSTSATENSRFDDDGLEEGRSESQNSNSSKISSLKLFVFSTFIHLFSGLLTTIVTKVSPIISSIFVICYIIAFPCLSVATLGIPAKSLDWRMTKKQQWTALILSPLLSAATLVLKILIA